MKKKIAATEILQELIKKREENILLLSKWTDEDLKEMAKRYREAQETAYQENRFEGYKILEEKLSQIYAAQDLKFSYTEEASDWIHW
jgi:predicted esterase YcpF (UPF0227 family)